MTRSLRSRPPGVLAAVVAVSTLLVVPALHGALDHVRLSCSVDATGCHVAAPEAALANTSATPGCPLCLASGQARSLLSRGAGPPPATPRPQLAAPRLPAPPPLPAPLALAVSAPRAPPLSS